MLRRLPPLKHPLRSALATRRVPLLSLLASSPRWNSTAVPPPPSSAAAAASSTSPPPPPPLSEASISAPAPPPRLNSSIYISNVLPIALGRWDFRPPWAILREESLIEKLHDIVSDLIDSNPPEKIHGFKVENFEVSRKDGGVFLHFSYLPPKPSSPSSPTSGEGETVIPILTSIAEEQGGIKNKIKYSPGALFIPLLEESAKKLGGWPSWLGQYWANWNWSHNKNVPGHTLYSTSTSTSTEKSTSTETRTIPKSEEEEGMLVKGSEESKNDLLAAVGGGRVWVVKGRQWTEDMSRFPSNRLRVEFDGPDVSQEMLYTLFRPYGRVVDIQPPTPVPAGSLRYATISFSRLEPAATAVNCLHGYSTPTNTADFTMRTSGAPPTSTIPLSRLRLYYERPLKAHAIRDWISAHPRISLPILAFLIGTLSYTFFDPIRAFFVRSKLEGIWDIEQYSLMKYLRETFVLPTSFGFLRGSSASAEESEEAVGKDAWKDRVVAERDVEAWLTEYPNTFITVSGPPGSGKENMVSRVLKQQRKPSMVIDCAEIAKAKNDAGLVSALADQTGYYPVFSFMSSMSGLIDLASVGLIGQKAGFSTPIDQQLRQMLEIVGGALKDVSVRAQNDHKQQVQDDKDDVNNRATRQRQRELIKRGGWHDGRIDCVAGNGAMSELGVGDEPFFENDLDAVSPPLMDDNAPINGEAVPPTSSSLQMTIPPPQGDISVADIDAEGELIKSLPIVVLKNFAQKTAKGDLWTVLAEWGASLVENRIAHVIVITEGATATKALTKALPAKPLNSVGLADADEENALAYVREKLKTISIASTSSSNTSGKDNVSHVLGNGQSAEESQQISKLGGRMVDLETLVYKVRTGSTIKDAVDDIVLRNVVELRKAAFGDDSEDAKSLPWSRAQAWKVVSTLAKKGEIPYAQLLQDFPFKGAEASLKALEEHELVSVTYIDGRASKVRPGKPVFRYAFEELVNDAIFQASCQIEYNTSLISKAETDIKSYENELTTLKSITTEGGSDALGVNAGWLGIGGHNAIKDRAKWLLDKMGKSVEKLGKLERENEEMIKVLASGQP